MIRELFAWSLAVLMLVGMGNAVLVEKTLTSANTIFSLNTFNAGQQTGTNTFVVLNSTNASDTQSLVIYYMDANFTKKTANYTLTGQTAINTSGYNSQYLVNNSTSAGNLTLTLSNWSLSSAGFGVNKSCPNYTNVYYVYYPAANYTTNMSAFTATSDLTQTDDGTFATLTGITLSRFSFINNTYPTALYYYFNPALNLTGEINSTNLVLPDGQFFASTDAFVATSSMPFAVTVRPNDNRTYNLTGNVTSASNATALTNANSTRTLILNQPRKRSEYTATMTVTAQYKSTVTTSVKIGDTVLGPLTGTSTTFTFDESLLAPTLVVGFSSNGAGTNITNIVVNYVPSGWYAIPSNRLVQNMRVVADVTKLSYCRNASLTSASATNNVVTNKFTKQTTKLSGKGDFAYIYDAALSSAAIGVVSIRSNANVLLYNITAGNTKPAYNGELCTIPNGCTLKNVIYGGDTNQRFWANVTSIAGVNRVIYSAFNLGYTTNQYQIPMKWGIGERLQILSRSATAGGNVSIYYEVG